MVPHTPVPCQEPQESGVSLFWAFQRLGSRQVYVFIDWLVAVLIVTLQCLFQGTWDFSLLCFYLAHSRESLTLFHPSFSFAGFLCIWSFLFPQKSEHSPGEISEAVPPSPLKFPQLTFPAGKTSGRQRQRPWLSPDTGQHLADGAIGKRKKCQSEVSQQSQFTQLHRTDPQQQWGPLLGQQYILRSVVWSMSPQLSHLCAWLRYPDKQEGTSCHR